MGSICSSPKPKVPTPKKTSNFGRDSSLNPKDFMVQNLQDETIIREPGSINGQQFLIEECKNCSIFLFDRSATITVDYCENCEIFIGPCESSAFIRNSTDCRIVMACQQFRTRDCKNLDVLLFSGTAPIIETSNHLRLGCFRFAYFSLEAQFEAANISVWNNVWSQIHDFSGSGHWQCLPETTTEQNLLRNITDEIKDRISFDPNMWVVPVTCGVVNAERIIGDEVIVSTTIANQDKARAILNELAVGDVKLIQTIQLTLQKNQLKTLFSNSQLKSISEQPIIGLHFKGPDAQQIVSQLVSNHFQDAIVYISTPQTVQSMKRNIFEAWRPQV